MPWADTLSWPEPLYLVDGSGLHYEDDGLSDEQRGAVERYLRSGVVLHEDGGDRLLTDGVFAWPEELARTYPGHGLRLPDDLVRLALERGGTVPPITQAQVEELRNRGIDVSGRPTEASTPPSPYPITRFATGRGGRARTFEAIPATLSSTGDVQDGVSSPTSSASKRGVSPLLIGLSAIILGLSVGTLLLARRQEEDEEEIDEEQEEEQEEIDAIEAQMKSGR